MTVWQWASNRARKRHQPSNQVALSKQSSDDGEGSSEPQQREGVLEWIERPNKTSFRKLKAYDSIEKSLGLIHWNKALGICLEACVLKTFLNLVSWIQWCSSFVIGCYLSYIKVNLKQIQAKFIRYHVSMLIICSIIIQIDCKIRNLIDFVISMPTM